MKLTQQIKLGQRLALTPQMQQTLQILQMSSVDLQDRVQQALESNIMLEADRDTEKSAPESTEPVDESVAIHEDDDPSSVSETAGTEMEVIPEQLPVDSDWNDIYDDAPGGFFTEDWWQNVPDKKTSLKAHLLEQLGFLNMSEEDNGIARIIIDAIDGKGYLRAETADIIAIADNDPTPKQVEKVLQGVQELDPPGVAARTPEECLLLQLDGRDDLKAEVKDLAQQILYSHIDLLAQDQALERLHIKLDCDRNTLTLAIAAIRGLDPHPGAAWADGQDPRNMTPELFVRWKEGRWTVELNQEASPRLRINSAYKSMIHRNDRSENQEALRSHLQEARWLISALKSRARILLKTATCIIRYQEQFLQHGEAYMKPLLLRQIAEELKVHESTISRAIAGKSMHTPQGVYELVFFFPVRLQTTTGETSSVAVKSIIKNLVDNEPVARPLSDIAISEDLANRGIKIARRTVAKYREVLNIPPRSQRRRSHLK